MGKLALPAVGDIAQTTLRGLWARYKGPLSLTYALSLFEQWLNLLNPWAIGWAIDDLLARSHVGLMAFVGLWVVHAAVGVGRKAYDTRVFMMIYGHLAAGVVERQHKGGTHTGKLIARAALMREIVDFFERDIPQLFAMAITFFGSLAMLGWYDPHLALVALAMLVPVLTLNGLAWRPLHRLNRAINDTLERQAAVIGAGKSGRLLQHFLRLRFLRVKGSDIEARSWGLIEIFVVIATVYVLTYAANKESIQAGTLYSVITYFWDYQGSLDRLPILVQSSSKVRDIIRRIEDG